VALRDAYVDFDACLDDEEVHCDPISLMTGNMCFHRALRKLSICISFSFLRVIRCCWSHRLNFASNSIFESACHVGMVLLRNQRSEASKMRALWPTWKLIKSFGWVLMGANKDDHSFIPFLSSW